MLPITDALLPSLLSEGVLVAMLVSLGLILYVPFFPGVAVMFVAIALRVGYMSFLAHTLVGIGPVDAVLVVLLSIMGVFSSFWVEKLELRFTYASQTVVWGAMICSLVFGIVLGGMLWFSAGLLVGAIAMEMREGRGFVEAARAGTAAIYSMLGPRGLQFLVALILVEVGAPALPSIHGLLN